MSWHWIVERKLQDAFAEGQFEDLPGAGQPLRWDDDGLVPPPWRAAFHLLRHSGLAPAWVMIDAQIRKDLAAARLEFARAIAGQGRRDSEDARAVDRFVRELSRINAAIDDLNLQVPSANLARGRLRPELEIKRIRGAAAQFEPGTTDD